MARIIVGTYVVRFPIGGYLSWVLQWLLGFRRLGHDVYLVEKSGWSGSCYDPATDVMSDDCSYGTTAISKLLTAYGLEDQWCYVDAAGCYHGMSRERIEALFDSADLFVDMATHGTWIGSWLEEASNTAVRVLIDGDPAYTQMDMELSKRRGETLPEYDHYYTVGLNIGAPNCTAPTAGRDWRTLCDPIVVDLFSSDLPTRSAPFTSVMSWHAYEPLTFDGVTYGMKDAEFGKFMDLPLRSGAPFELAVSGDTIPEEDLAAKGWQIRNPLDVATTFDSFRDYILFSRGEFSVCKQVFVATRSGAFSERSAAYLASGRPVVMQDTGFSQYLPCGRGLFAVADLEGAVEAIEEIQSDYARHSRWARELAFEHLDASKILPSLMSGLGLQ